MTTFLQKAGGYMALSKYECKGGVGIRVDGEVTRAEAAAVKEALVDAMRGARRMELDLGGLKFMDTAGVQLFVSLMKTAEATGLKLSMNGKAQALVDGAARLGFDLRYYSIKGLPGTGG
jgi:anti-anti-sigma factor